MVSAELQQLFHMCIVSGICVFVSGNYPNGPPQDSGSLLGNHSKSLRLVHRFKDKAITAFQNQLIPLENTLDQGIPVDAAFVRQGEELLLTLILE